MDPRIKAAPLVILKGMATDHSQQRQEGWTLGSLHRDNLNNGEINTVLYEEGDVTK